MALLFHYGLRSLWVRRTTTWAALAGTALTAFVFAASFMLAAGLRNTALDAGDADRALVLQTDAFSEGDSRFRQAETAIVAAAPGVRRDSAGPLVSPEAIVHVSLPSSRDSRRMTSIQVRGVTEAAYRLRPELVLVAGRLPTAGTDEAAVGLRVRGRYPGLELGSGFELQKNQRVNVVGVFAARDSALESEVWADIDRVRSAFGFQGFVSSVTARLVSERDFDAFAAALALNKTQGLTAERERAYYQKVSNNLTRVIAFIGGLISSIFALGAALGCAIAMYGSLSQRRSEIGVLRALGFSRSQILWSLLAEAIALALAGGALGIACALGLSLVKISVVNWATGQELIFGFTPEPAVVLAALASGAVVGSIGGLFPAISAARLAPARAIRAG
jgi:cell division protein FtsX